MSALQKYKREAASLKEENERLKEEIERLKTGRPLKSEIPSSSSLKEKPDLFFQQSKEMAKDLRGLLLSELSGATMAMAASKIECALVEAYNLGLRQERIDDLLKTQ